MKHTTTAKNAIILAAGFGMRMVPINMEQPKGLLRINGQPIIEHTIMQLHNVGISDITIVVGFMKECYEYLVEKYGVTLVVNTDYANRNNIYSLQLASDKIRNTYIIPCDIYCRQNPFSINETYSWYMVTDRKSENSNICVNSEGELLVVESCGKGNDMLGIAYINDEKAIYLRNKIKQICEATKCSDAFWEKALYEEGRMIVRAKVVSAYENFEINTFEQLREIDKESENLKSDVLSLIANVFNTEEEKINNISMLKKGMTNRSFKFSVENNDYIMRIPGNGTDKLINRMQEYKVYSQIKDLNICEKIYYINPYNGYKIAGYIDNANNCDAYNWEEVKKCIMVLKEFHEKKLKVQHTFDLYDKLEFYEKLWKEKSKFNDYEETKANVYRLKKFIEKQDKEWTLTHIDANADNFLIWKDKEQKEKITLIDWEYAAMQDAHLDIAMFGIYSMYDREGMDKLIDCYFEGMCDNMVRLKIYAYIAVGGMIWSNWCEYKRQSGQEFGEYSTCQYMYAKKYSKIVLDKLEELNV